METFQKEDQDATGVYVFNREKLPGLCWHKKYE